MKPTSPAPQCNVVGSEFTHAMEGPTGSKCRRANTSASDVCVLNASRARDFQPVIEMNIGYLRHAEFMQGHCFLPTPMAS